MSFPDQLVLTLSSPNILPVCSSRRLGTFAKSKQNILWKKTDQSAEMF